MGIDVKLSSGNGGSAKVTEDESLLVTNFAGPEFGKEQKIIPYVKDLTLNGDGVTTSLSVNGSSTPQMAWVSASATNDIYISYVSIAISDASASLNKFGAITALTNGFDLYYNTNLGNINILTGVKTNYELIRGGLIQKGWGDGITAFQLKNATTTNDDTYLVNIPVKEFVIPYGLLLKDGTNQRLTLQVNDDLSTVASFTAKAFGFERLP